jgi:hypothetical protein
MIAKPNDRSKAIEYLNFLFDKGKSVKIESVSGKRSLSENAYMHGVVFTVFAVELGWLLDEAKQYFKKLFLSYEKHGQKFERETSKLDVKEMEHFLECCRTHSLKEHGIRIPLPNEVTDEVLEELIKYQKYLK